MNDILVHMTNTKEAVKKALHNTKHNNVTPLLIAGHKSYISMEDLHLHLYK